MQQALACQCFLPARQDGYSGGMGQPSHAAQTPAVPLRQRGRRRVDVAQAEPSTKSNTSRNTIGAPADFAAVTSSRDGDFGQNGAVSPGRQQAAKESLEPAKVLRGWSALPARYQMVVSASVAFIICNMDKVNISVAIIPMAADFGWSPTVSGLVQSSFFWGYALSQIPGGYLNSKIGGRKVLPVGVGLWSAATAAVPFVGGIIPALYASRAAVGLGEGVAPSGATDMVARCIAKEERARAISFIFSGLHVGSLLGLIVAPPLIENFGWESVFYIFGVLGFAWVLWFQSVMAGIQENEPDVAHQLIAPPKDDPSDSASETTPWRAFARNVPLRALAYTHFCNNWFHYTMLAWLPTYFTDTLSLNLTQAAQVSLIPPVAALATSAIAGPAADYFISNGAPVARVRKASQCIAFLGPTACLSAAALTDDHWLAVGLITASLGLSSFSLAGLYCNHADLSPRHASLLLGITNTSGAIPGIIGVAFTGMIMDLTGSWALALFLPSIVFFMTGAAIYTIFGSADRQDFSNNSPLALEGFPVIKAFKRLPFTKRKDEKEL